VLHHVNFHTIHGLPLFDDARYDGIMRACLTDVLHSRGMLCAAWEVMPTHVHMIVEEFPDMPCGTILKHVKGDTARAFFRTFPDTRADFPDGHLWKRGYFSVGIVSHRQFVATVRYVQQNRAHAGLALPLRLEYRE